MSDLYLGEFSTDVTPPEVTNPSPSNGAEGVGKFEPVEFDITDTETGVDTSSIDVTIGGVDAIVGGVFQTPDYDGTITDMGGGTWHVTISTHPKFASYTTISVTVDGQDLAPIANVMAQYSWSFESTDYEAPYVQNNTPTGSGVGVGVNIEFDLKDDGWGVDLDTVTITVGGTLAYDGFLGPQPGFAVVVTGDPSSYHFVVNPDTDFAEWTTYNVAVYAQDLDPSVVRTATFDSGAREHESFDNWDGILQLFDDATAEAATFDSGGVEYESFDNWSGVWQTFDDATADAAVFDTGGTDYEPFDNWPA